MSKDLINEQEVDNFRPLTPQQADIWRSQHPQVSVWQVLRVQCWVSLVVVSIAYGLEVVIDVSGLWLSAMYGSLVVVLPGLVCARGLGSKFGGNSVAASVAKFFVWEFSKVALSVSMLVIAPRLLVHELNWPSLMVGLVFTFKGFWVFVVWQQCRGRKSFKTN